LQYNATSSQSRVLVYSVIGKLLINKNIENVDGNNSVSISVEDLKDGLYFVTLQNGDQKLTKAFIKK
jgi:hypothetical protein